MEIDRAWKLHKDIERKLARGAGRVYTPRRTAFRLADLILSPLTEAPSLLDPACGAGALLLGALEWAASARPQWLSHWSHGGLHAWDIDPEAVEGANAVFRAAGIPAGAIVRDGLTATGEYDAVIANPPWISYSGRHAAKLSAPRKRELAARFAAFAGWPALHTAFAEQCARLTRQDGGRLGLILPMQMSDLAGYAAARRAVTSHLSLEHVIELGENEFANVTEPAGLFVFGGSAGADRAWLPGSDADLLARVRSFAPLPAACFGDVGVHTGNAADLLVGRDGPGKPLRVGRDIEPFRLAPATHVLRAAELPPGRYARVADECRYREALIVLRQTADRPIAARHQPWGYFRNSVLACYGDPRHDVDYLLGVLNSDVIARIHRSMFRDARQRTFPQVKISHLRALPVPGPEIGPVYDRIANAVRARDFSAANELVSQAYASAP
ncbi:MAG: N-6 DNA methylase [Planctomycetes bacterium]|nr:N-6 DNA methylase [Planctomycetota bacterium]